MTKAEVIKRLEELFTNPRKKLKERTGLSRVAIWRWFEKPDYKGTTQYQCALDLIEEGKLATEALEAIGQPIKL